MATVAFFFNIFCLRVCVVLVVIAGKRYFFACKPNTISQQVLHFCCIRPHSSAIGHHGQQIRRPTPVQCPAATLCRRISIFSVSLQFASPCVFFLSRSFCFDVSLSYDGCCGVGGTTP